MELGCKYTTYLKKAMQCNSTRQNKSLYKSPLSPLKALLQVSGNIEEKQLCFSLVTNILYKMIVSASCCCQCFTQLFAVYKGEGNFWSRSIPVQICLSFVSTGGQWKKAVNRAPTGNWLIMSGELRQQQGAKRFILFSIFTINGWNHTGISQ